MRACGDERQGGCSPTSRSSITSTIVIRRAVASLGETGCHASPGGAKASSTDRGSTMLTSVGQRRRVGRCTLRRGPRSTGWSMSAALPGDIALGPGPPHPRRAALDLPGRRRRGGDLGRVDPGNGPSRRGEALRVPRLPPDPHAGRPPRLAVRVLLGDRGRRRRRAGAGPDPARARPAPADPAVRADPDRPPPGLPRPAARRPARLLARPGVGVARGDPGPDRGGDRPPGAPDVLPGRRGPRRCRPPSG